MQMFVIGGPNGAGKSTSVKELMPTLLRCEEYVNSDSIAQSLSPFHPDSVAIQAGRLALNRIRYLAKNGIDFAFETTLASKTFLKFLNDCKRTGYIINIIFFYLNEPNLAIQRVADRVKAGGHNIPQDVITRRYKRSICNFINHYMLIADSWFLYDNSKDVLTLISKNEKNKPLEIFDNVLWTKLLENAKDESSF